MVSLPGISVDKPSVTQNKCTSLHFNYGTLQQSSRILASRSNCLVIRFALFDMLFIQTL